MKIVSRILMSVLLFCLGVEVGAQEIKIEITTPLDGATVKQRHDVKGHVSDSKAIVIVVIRPTKTSEFWVQPPVTVKKSGVWKVKAHFGRVGKDKGEEYEVRAFVNPSSTFSIGKIGNWPIAQAQSDVIDVTRN